MQPHALGHIFDNSAVTAFFGDRGSTPELLKKHFPGLAFVYLSQSHSDTVVLAKRDPIQSADAHLTGERGLALCIRTADCLPVLIHDPETQFVASIHAGWRGVENEIVRKSCQKMRSFGSSLSKAHAWIGPHIGPKSFEVGDEVARRLFDAFSKVQSFAPDAKVVFPHQDPQKALVDLLTITRAQLRCEGIDVTRQSSLPIDTFTSDQHSSFRRDAGNAGRQVSFIVMK